MIFPNVIKKDGSQRGILIFDWKVKEKKFSVMLTDDDWSPILDKDSVPTYIEFDKENEMQEEWEIFHFEHE